MVEYTVIHIISVFGLEGSGSVVPIGIMSAQSWYWVLITGHHCWSFMFTAHVNVERPDGIFAVFDLI